MNTNNILDASFTRYEIWCNTHVSLNDVKPFLTDANDIREAVNAYLVTKEENWVLENPKPVEARFLNEWFFRRISTLYDECIYIINGKEVSGQEAYDTGVRTWNIKVSILFDEDLAKEMDGGL